MTLDHRAAPPCFLGIPVLGRQPVDQAKGQDKRNADHRQPTHQYQNSKAGFQQMAYGEEDLVHNELALILGQI